MLLSNKSAKKRKSKIRDIGGKKLFLMTLPFLIIIFIFAYVPLFGWSFAFFDYKAGHKLFNTPFVVFKYFMVPFSNPILRADIARVLRNTLAMSFLGIGTSMFPMFFAILLAEIGCKPGLNNSPACRGNRHAVDSKYPRRF